MSLKAVSTTRTCRNMAPTSLCGWLQSVAAVCLGVGRAKCFTTEVLRHVGRWGGDMRAIPVVL